MRLTMLFLVACHGGENVGNDGEVVGGPCIDARDCANRCERDEDFPGGTCTLSCNTDGDCPSGTLFINRGGGICLLGCGRPEDCRAGYSCEGERRSRPRAATAVTRWSASSDVGCGS